MKLGRGEYGSQYVCYADSIPLNVRLDQTHWGERPFKEVHVGLAKMQQCFEQDIAKLFREDLMAPGKTHMPMFDKD